MEQGNSNKIKFIVEEIVKNNDIFKLKSPIEQDKEKEFMEKSINSALSDLNEVGKELVLQDLAIDPDERFKGFIDNAGNIDISGIIKFTATIVKNKIEEAEREGIDLRKDAPTVLKNNNIVVTEGVLTIVVIDRMIKDYDKLSSADKNSLAKNWNNMLPKQKKEYSIALGNALKRKADTVEDPNIKKQIENAEQEVRKMPENEERYAYQIDNMNDDQLQEYLKKMFGKDSSIFRLTPKEQREKLKVEYNERDKEALVDVQDYERKESVTDTKELKSANRMFRCNKYAELGINNELPITLEDFNQRTDKEQDWIIKYVEKKLKGLMDLEDFLQREVISDITEKKGMNESTLQETQQIPSILLKQGFTLEQIQESINQYKAVIEQLPEKYISKIENVNVEDRANMLNIILTKKGNITPEIAEHLSKIDYDGQLIDILRDENRRAELVEQLNQLIEPTKEQQVTDTEVQQGIKQGTIKQEDMIVATEQERTTQESKQTEKENYSFINAQYLEQDSMEGLIPRNGGNSKAIQDDKTAIFYSQGKEGAIVMYFEFLRQYENLRGERGDKALQKYEAYQNGSIQLTEEQLAQLEAQIEQIKDIRDSQSFDEFMGDKLYLKIDGLDREEDKKKADEWRKTNPGTKMDYNYANSWTEETITPDRIDVVTLQRNDGTDMRVSQKDIITYFLSQTSIEKIAELGINNTTLGLIQGYYEDHRSEITEFGTEYSLLTQNIKEFAQSRENKGQEVFDAVQAATVTEGSRTENQEEFAEKATVQGVKDLFKLTKTSGVTGKDVSEQRTVLGEQVKGQETSQELEDEDKQQ